MPLQCLSTAAVFCNDPNPSDLATILLQAYIFLSFLKSLQWSNMSVLCELGGHCQLSMYFISGCMSCF